MCQVPNEIKDILMVFCGLPPRTKSIKVFALLQLYKQKHPVLPLLPRISSNYIRNLVLSQGFRMHHHPTYRILYRSLGVILSTRYLYERISVQKAPERVEWLLEQVDDKRFKQEARMYRNNRLSNDRCEGR
ncbi:hypothetical protein BKA69DRAFT_1083186 [Paraphysoderma sedebokerense]|nr:hypothetical protein BKA69DRAFT_1083186 [Paraphysoderma sedebokerense]